MKKQSAVSAPLQDKIFYVCNYVFWVIILLATLYPLYFVLIASVSNAFAVVQGEVTIWPVGFTLSGYESLIKFTQLWRSYLNSIVYTVLGTVMGLIFTLMAAYATTHNFLGKAAFNFIVIFTMFFSGGLIATWLVVKDVLHLYDNPLILILTWPTVWKLMLTRVFIKTTIPNELYEAATLDGASHFYYFSKVVLPLCGTIIAVLCVYIGVDKWNDYFSGLIYIRSQEWLPLQTVLRTILASLQVQNADLINANVNKMDRFEDYTAALRRAELAKYCIIVVSTAPAVALYVAMQKYFVKGVMIGSIKG